MALLYHKRFYSAFYFFVNYLGFTSVKPRTFFIFTHYEILKTLIIYDKINVTK